MPNEVWDEITFPFRNFNGATIEIWEWISNFTPSHIMDITTYHTGIKVDQVSKRAPADKWISELGWHWSDNRLLPGQCQAITSTTDDKFSQDIPG